MEMDAPGGDGRDGPRERRGHSEAGRQNLDVRPQSGANGLPKHSYWLDLWLFILFDAVVFLLVYFLPCLLNVNTARMRTFRMIHFHLVSAFVTRKGHSRADRKYGHYNQNIS
nr:uncharacterized protein C4orf3 homolog isoform X1 [Callithrix jacchus]